MGNFSKSSLHKHACYIVIVIFVNRISGIYLNALIRSLSNCQQIKLRSFTIYKQRGRF